MKYTPEEALSEILYRSERMVIKRIQRICRGLAGLCGVLLAALIISITHMSEQAAETSPHSLYGSFLLDREAGGYVLIALIAFVLGVTVALLCMHWRNKQEGTGDGEKNE